MSDLGSHGGRLDVEHLSQLTQVPGRRWLPCPEAPAGTRLHMALEALALAFSERALHEPTGEVFADNTRPVHKKVGFTEEGRFRQQHMNKLQTPCKVR